MERPTTKRENQNKLIRWISWLPAIIVMSLIFAFSAKPAVESQATSTPLARALLNVWQAMFGTTMNHQEGLDIASIFVRKTAHITEYILLAISISWPLWIRGLYGKRFVITSFLCSVIYAATDEFHQLFVEGRSGSLKDVGIDAIGCIIGAFLFYSIVKVKKRSSKTIS